MLLWFPGFGYIVFNNGAIAQGPDNTTAIPTGTDAVVVLLDSAGKLYFQVNGNNIFGADPAAGTGGCTIPTGSYFATASFSTATAEVTADFTPGSLPSGFSDWDAAASPDLFPPLYTDTDSFFAPAVVGPRELTAPLLSDTDSFFAGTVNRTPNFGELRGTLQANNNTIPTNFSATGSVTVEVGDLILSVVCQQTALTVTGVTDNLGNSYTAQNAGTDAGNVTGRVFYSIATNAGTLTSVTAACTTSANDGVHIVGVFKGKFTAIDANPANITSDVTSPYSCPSSGTLAQADEVVFGWGVASYGTSWLTSSPSTQAIQLANSTTIKAALNYRLVSATTAVAPAFTAASNPGQAVLGTLSFKKDLTQALTATLFDEGDTFFDPTVSQSGAGDLTPALYTDTDTFLDATVGRGAVTLSASLFTDTDSFQTATVAPGAAPLTAALYTDADSFFDPAVTVGSVNMTAALFTDTDAFFSPTVSQGATALTAALFTDSDTIFNATVTATYSLTPALFSDGDTFHAATVGRSTMALTPGLFTDSDSFFSATVAATYALTPALFTDTDSFFSATVAAGAAPVVPSLFVDTDSFYSAAISAGGSLIAPDPFVDTDTFFAATVGRGTIALTAPLLTDTDTFFQPIVGRGTVALTAGLFTDTDSFGAATAASTYALTAARFNDADVFFTPVASSSKALTPSLFVDTDTFHGGAFQQDSVFPSLFEDTDTFGVPVITTGGVTLAPSLFVDQDLFGEARVTHGQGGGGTSAPPQQRKDKRLKTGFEPVVKRPRPPEPEPEKPALPAWLPKPKVRPAPVAKPAAELVDPRMVPGNILETNARAMEALEQSIRQREYDEQDMADIMALLETLD